MVRPMPSGFEDYVLYIDSDAGNALTRANQHLLWLMQQKKPRVADAGASHDSTSLDQDIDRTRADIKSLRSQVSRSGLPQMVPCRRRV